MQRLEFIRACQMGTESFSALCRRFGISRKTGNKWLQRFDPDDPTSLFDKSRARLTHPDRIPPDVIQQLINIRLAHPDWGPKKIRGWLINHHAPFCVPAASTISDILARERLIIPRIYRGHAPGNHQPLTPVSEVNQVWKADIKGKFRLLSQEYCHPFTLTDNHSRYLLACQGTFRESESFVRDCLTRTFLEYGVPEVLKTDNGQPFDPTHVT